MTEETTKTEKKQRYRKIEVRLWSDERFRQLSPLPPCAQGLWFYLLTGPHTNPIPGIFRCGRAAMAEELNWDLEAFDKAFAEVLLQGMVKADWKAKVVWIPNAIKYNKPESPNVIIGWAQEWELIPECDLKREAYDAMKANIDGLSEAFGTAFGKAIAKPSPKPTLKTMANQEQEQEQEQEQKKDQKHVDLTINETTQKPEKTLNISFEDFWNAYDKKRAPDVCRKRWAALTNAERKAAMDYIPKYIAAQPEKLYRKDPATFLNQKSWRDEIIAATSATATLNTALASQSSTASSAQAERMSEADQRAWDLLNAPLDTRRVRR